MPGTTSATKKTTAKKATGTRKTTESTKAAEFAEAEAEVAQIQINEIDTQTMLVPIVGTQPLVVHNFSDKSKQQMLDAQQGRKSPKVNRDPQAEYQAAFYLMQNPDGGEPLYGFPATAFKAATIGAARFYKGVRMTELRQALFFKGILTPLDPQQLVQIHGTPEMREDVVRLGGASRSADLRYRPAFNQWHTTLEVTFVKSALSQASVLSLIDAGGFGVGVGEWRPERNGSMGTFKIDPDREVSVV